MRWTLVRCTREDPTVTEGDGDQFTVKGPGQVILGVIEMDSREYRQVVLTPDKIAELAQEQA